MQARTRNESIALRAAESLAQQLARESGIEADWLPLLRAALAEAEDDAPAPSRPIELHLNIHTRGVPPEDL